MNVEFRTQPDHYRHWHLTVVGEVARLAADRIILVDDGTASVALPEAPLLAVLPGTGGLTRLIDERFVRRDLADVFSTVEEGIKGHKAVEWRLVDETIPTSRFAASVDTRLVEMVKTSDRPSSGPGIVLTALEREITDMTTTYPSLEIELDRGLGTATIVIHGPGGLVRYDGPIPGRRHDGTGGTEHQRHDTPSLRRIPPDPPRDVARGSLADRDQARV